MTVKNIIFDLGGVILDLGFERMTAAFEALGVHDFRDYFTPQAQMDFFEALELGLISEAAFYEKFRTKTGVTLTDERIRESWNLILTDFDPARMTFLEKLSETHALYLFSNTNAIHVACFEARCLAQLGKPLGHYFKALYYSSDLHLRKPESAAFEKVLELSGLEAAETLFVDDTAANIAGAQTVGLQTWHLQASQTVMDLRL